jgi:hypothetical protein
VRSRLLIAGLAIVGMAIVVASPAPATALGLKGQGHYNCASASGSMQFSPPLTTDSNGKATARVAIDATGCSGGNPTPATVTMSGKSTFEFAHDFCIIGETMSKLTTLSLTYGSEVSSSKLVRSSIVILDDGQAGIGGNVRGSYPVSNQQASASFAYSVVGNCSSGVTGLSLSQSTAALVDF